ncbi:DUF4097 family beta strand repeat-containing protein [Actinophytocola oryzae]|uniref:Putative adhesin n=1 Tax=Actinophytocola oryzae TaxID=502181 RepID=A0A4R7VM93_9PSEU|nr:DUF4097 family beta strand repeat-containing protein [Actinophytocola oryzae]TDV50720.1 putative adhesin [Actinophytocola oryzae]
MGIKHVVAGITILSGGLLLTACDWGARNQFTDQESFGRAVSEVRFANDSGDVKIRVGDSFEVRRTVGYRNDMPGKTYRLDGDALVLEACADPGCSVSYDVTVPKGAKVSGHLDSGNIELTGVASANVEAESGDVTIRDVAGEVNASAQSGNVTLSGIGGAVVAKAESGNVEIGLTDAADVTANTESGNIDVTVPDAEYQVDIQTDEGENITNDLGDGDVGPKISLSADSGTVSLKPV